MTPRPRFSIAAAEHRLGPVVTAAARRVAAAGPPLSNEQREWLRAVFATARPQPAAIKRAA